MALEGEVEGDSEEFYQGENYIRMFIGDAINKQFSWHCKREFLGE